ncbi:MAG TPA: heterodisulfide reductase-related iron-sulfur binding cluster [Streptosporangiaceae bacterium]|nr:heterodisulfide reductase-related iron-sulfur binding cluster [Streptosporangiaceae bacterium]
MHCGFCLPACPTYSLWGEEMDSPRGRIHLVTQVLDGDELTPAAAEHFDRCLGCMACMPACPSGVQYNRLIEAARAWTDDPEHAPPVQPGSDLHEVAGADGVDESGESGEAAGAAEVAPQVPVGGGRHRPWPDRAARAAIFAVFPYRQRLRLLTGPLRGLQRTGLDRLVARTGLPSKLSPVLGAAMNLAPRPGPPVPRGRLPERVAARGERRAVVGMLTGCVQSVFFGHVNVATARVLAAEGCDVVIPRQQECCGALSLHSGRAGEGADFARALIETFEQAGVEAIVVNSAGCGSAMKEYAELLADDPVWADRARALSAKVRDFSEFLVELFERSGGPAAPRHPVPARATYHDACHLGHAQGITAAPRQLLAGVPDLEVREIPDAGMCCGSAGVYNLLQPEAAGELGRRKAQSVLSTGAELLISANPGCSLQIASALEAQGESIAIAHTAEILDASIRGVPAPGPA